MQHAWGSWPCVVEIKISVKWLLLTTVVLSLSSCSLWHLSCPFASQFAHKPLPAGGLTGEVFRGEANVQGVTWTGITEYLLDKSIDGDGLWCKELCCFAAAAAGWPWGLWWWEEDRWGNLLIEKLLTRKLKTGKQKLADHMDAKDKEIL